MFKAIVWDFGGVLTTSPFEAFSAYETTHGLPKDFIRGVNAINPDTNAWALFEQARITAAEFDTLFRQESASLGHEIAGSDVLALLSGELRPRVVEALKTIAQSYKTGCITNNVPIGHGAGMATDGQKGQAIGAVMALFDHVLESSKIGIRKPDPRIYEMMCNALKVEPNQCIYLDDLGINLKPARQMGMTTIKVTSQEQLLVDLQAVLEQGTGS